MKWTVLGSLHLSVVIPQVLLQVRELDKGASALGQVTLVGPFAWMGNLKINKSVVINIL